MFIYTIGRDEDMKKSRWILVVLILAAVVAVVAIFWPKIKEEARRRGWRCCGGGLGTGSDSAPVDA
jgi:hypothetical protein